GLGAAAPRPMPEESPGFAVWIDDFFRSYYARRPVNATFIGVHDHDHRLPDFSENGAGDTRAEMEGLLRRSADLDHGRLGATDRLDLDLARGFLRIQLWEEASAHFHRGNPSLYTGEAVFGVLSLFLTAFAPLSDRAEAAVRRMEDVPRLLDEGRRSLRTAPSEWTARAIRECDGALAFFREGIAFLAAEEGVAVRGLEAAAERAARA